MCGRFLLEATNLKTEYNLASEVKIQPRYNISPSRFVPVIVSEQGKNIIKMMKWGFELKFGNQPPKQLINAMGETLNEKLTFKKLLGTNRCIIPATGFYEWAKTASGKIPHYIFLKEQKIFSLGGLYRIEKNQEGEEEFCCVIITTASNSLMAPIHNRMPLIIEKSNEYSWLNSNNQSQVQALIKPCDSGLIKAITVSKKVNNANSEGPDLLEEFRWELGQEIKWG